MSPLIFFFFISSRLVFAEQINCRAPGPEFPDIAVRCDKEAECGDYCARNQLSVDFLCCEDGTGWVAAHVLNPLLFYMFWQDAVWTALVVLLFEVMEIAFLTLAGGFVIFPTTPTELETWAGSLLGDGLLQGGTGLLFGILITYTWSMPPLVSSVALARATPGGSARRARYIFFWAFQTAFFLALPWTNAEDTARYGLYLCSGVHVVLVAFLYPRLLLADWPVDGQMLWRGARNRTVPKGGFYAWAVVIVALTLSTAGWRYLANDWFQVWLTSAVLLVVYSVQAVSVAARRRDGYMVVTFMALLLILLATGLAIAGEAFSSVAILLAGVPALFLALAVCLCNTALLHSSARLMRIPGRPK